MPEPAVGPGSSFGGLSVCLAGFLSVCLFGRCNVFHGTCMNKTVHPSILPSVRK